jgi:C4-dicarboxylate transporter, DctM subunit
MTGTEIGIIGTVILLLLLCLGAHIGFSLILVGFFGFAAIGGINGAIGNLFVVPYNEALNSYTFAVIPLFLLMSEFVGQSGIGTEAYLTARTWLGQLKGGLAMATIGACGLFAAVSGSSLAGTMVMGRVAYPEMMRAKYSKQLASGVCVAGGTLGILIPPSMGFVLIGILSDLSIVKLFLAGILPGISVIIFYWITIFIMCRIDPKLAPSSARTTLKEKVVSTKYTWSIGLLFVLMMWGIYTGIFTATEAAGIGAAGALVVGLIKKGINGRNFWQALMDTSKMAAMIIIMVIGAYMFNKFLAISRIPTTLGDFMAGLPIPSYGLLAIIIVFYLICGMFFDIYAVLILTIPILFPVIKTLGFDLIWYSVIMVRVVEVGFISPPFGLNVFALAGMIKEPLGVLYRGVIPFCISDCLNIIFLCAFPMISLWLPRMS